MVLKLLRQLSYMLKQDSKIEVKGDGVWLPGAVGWNWYMLVNRDNWYQAPINELGDFRLDLKPVFQELTQLYHQLKPSECVKLTNTAVTFSYAHYRNGYAHKEDALLKSFYHADLDYEFCDLETGRNGDKKILFYSGEEWLPKKEQKYLSDYVQKGGTLVFFQKFPYLDEKKKPLNVLDLPFPDAVLGGREILSHKKILQLQLGKNVQVDSQVFIYAPLKLGTPLWAKQVPSEGWELQWKLCDNKRYCVGHLYKRGKGRILLLGLLPNPEILHALHQKFGVSRYAVSETGGVNSTLFQRKKEHFLIATNNRTEAVDACISLNIPITSASSLTRKIPIRMISKKKGIELFFKLPPKSGDILSMVSN